LIVLCAISGIAADRSPAPRAVELVNNQTFRVWMPLRVRHLMLGNGSWTTDEGQAVQQSGADVVLVADLAASSRKRISFRQSSNATPSPSLLTLRPDVDTIVLTYGGKEFGRMAWDIIVRREKPERKTRNTEPPTTRADFSAQFQALPLTFQRSARGAVFDTWTAEATKAGLKLVIELRAFHDGFLDMDAQLINTAAAETSGVYAAVVTRWEQPAVASRSLCYDNHLASFGDAQWTPFRAGEGRHLFVQRGVDWLRSTFANNSTTVVWLNDFAESFTVRQAAAEKRPARYLNANIPQLGQEMQTAVGSLYSITEIARSNIASYRARFIENVLPLRGEKVSFSSRLIFNNAPLADTSVDDMFVAYAGYAEQRRMNEGTRVSIGVPFVRFGTNYFPYSTLGENFDMLKLPGMDREAYWPLAADTVTEWRLFADDIRRDLRIAKAMGFELIRLHHLELIAPLDAKVKTEYLDFLFAEMRHLGLRALLDVQMSPEETAGIVARYRNLIDGVEIENEVLIFGINENRQTYWNAVYDAVKKVAPEMRVHLTASTNTEMFTRLAQLGGKTDRIGAHSYMDSLDAIPSARGFALAAANYATKAGKEPVITEWNWRGLTRMTPEARAKAYAPIFENVLKTRSIPEFYQFQFNESLAMNPQTLKGIRHYEPIWLSRRPKPEAFELMRLVKEYSAPTAPNHMLAVAHEVVTLDANGRGVAQFRITNTSLRALKLRASIETPSNAVATLQSEKTAINLAPNAFVTVPVSIAIKETSAAKTPAETRTRKGALPGFYHIFLRLEGEANLVRYGWAEARFAGAPEIDKSTKSEVQYIDGAFDYDFNRPLAVVYGDDASVLELETASALVNSLESATGRPVGIYQLSDLPADMRARGALVVIGISKTNPLIPSVAGNLSHDVSGAKQFVARVPADAAHGDLLVVSGASAQDAEKAAMDLIVRYWKYAKDSAARRIGLVAKELPSGGDPAQLP